MNFMPKAAYPKIIFLIIPYFSINIGYTSSSQVSYVSLPFRLIPDLSNYLGYPMKRKINKKTIIFLFTSILLLIAANLVKDIPIAEIKNCVFDFKLIDFTEVYN
jgi:hypothetical protein